MPRSFCAVGLCTLEIPNSGGEGWGGGGGEGRFWPSHMFFTHVGDWFGKVAAGTVLQMALWEKRPYFPERSNQVSNCIFNVQSANHMVTSGPL